MDVVSARRAGPRLSLLLGIVVFELARLIALGAMRVFPVLGVPRAPKILKARIVVRKLAHELHDRVLRLGGSGALRALSVSRWHRLGVLSYA